MGILDIPGLTRAQLVGLAQQSLTGTQTLAVETGHTYEITATGNTTLTLTAASGTQAALVVTTAGFNVIVAGKALGGGTYVAHKVTAGWNIHPVGSATIIVPPGVASPSISGVTTTTATATWAAVATATGYNVRVNGGSTINAGNVLTYQATGLPSSTAGTIEVQAYNAAGTSAWASAGFTTATPAPVVLRLTNGDTPTITESGNATDGYNYAFAGTPYGKSAYSTLKAPVSTDCFVEWTVGNLTGPGVSSAARPSVVLASTSGIFGTAITSVTMTDYSGQVTYGMGNLHRGNTPTFPIIQAANGDRVRLGRTGTNTWSKVSKDGGATWTDLWTFTNGGTTQVWMRTDGNVYTGQVNNVRALNFA